MPVPNPVMPVKGAGTTLWVYKGNGDPYANPLSDVDWSVTGSFKPSGLFPPALQK